jgi:ubiquinone/menaquinone biosynthesis C-methylase UbiE
MSRIIWNIQSGFYGFLRQNPISSAILKKENAAAADLLKFSPAGNPDPILDIGSGPGDSLSLLGHDRYPMVSADLSLSMLKKARRKFPDYYFVHADAVQLPFKPNLFGLITCLGVSEYQTNLPAFLNELKRITKKDGFILISFSRLGLLNFSRFVLGHRIFLRNREIISNVLGNIHLEVVEERQTLLQMQMLLKKSNQ